MVAILVGVGVGVLGAAAFAGLRHVRRTYFVVTVSGRSMEPTLLEGDRVLARRVPVSAVRAGRVVVFGSATADRWIVKRAVALPGDPVPRGKGLDLPPSTGDIVPSGQMVVLGDNPAESTDSRNFGFLSTEWLQGVAIRRIGATAGDQPLDLH
ncbi:signal peptidase I [Nonomuraea sp. SYSU D8015]|uniref:signal peptidase I n=1 Tax=Nonomuraea sp. SYSU D8015 TaxID=2593644 RepID=UPI001CB6FDA9|nr:signal peptidase I [Nonomuraea sp. SYSU D8015]